MTQTLQPSQRFLKIYLLLICASIVPCSFAQNSDEARAIVSLRLALSKNTSDTSRALTLLQIAYAYSQNNNDSALYYANLAKQLAEKANWAKGSGSANTALGLYYAADFDYKKAEDSYARALNIYEKSRLRGGIAAVYANWSILYKTKGDYATALETAFNALKIMEDLGDTINRPIVLENIGTIYMREKKYEKTLDYYDQALAFYSRANDKEGQARNLGNKGIVLNELGEYARALQLHQLAFKTNKETGNLASQQINLANLGITYLKLKQYNAALRHYLLALNLSKRLKDKSSIAINLGNIGELYLMMAKETDSTRATQHLEEAVKYLKNAVRLCRETGFTGPHLEFLKYLSDANMEAGNYRDALIAFKEYTAVHDSVFSRESRVQIAALENKRAADVQNRDSRLKRQRLKIESLQEVKKRNEKIIFAFCIILLVISIAMLYRLFKLRNAKHRKVLSDIATIQSHEVRGPLARILGLVPLLELEHLTEENKKIVAYLDQSAHELDEAIKRTVNATYEKPN